MSSLPAVREILPNSQIRVGLVWLSSDCRGLGVCRPPESGRLALEVETATTHARVRYPMKNSFLILGLTVCCLLVVQFLAVAEQKALTVDGAKLCKAKWPIPKSKEWQDYLGLSGGGDFNLSQVKADLLVVQVFSMYCPICQAEAENVNKLYSLVQADAKLNRRVKIVGLGIGNTPFEVEVFRKKYNVPFPLIPDPDFQTQSCADEKFRTPTFIVLRLENRTCKTLFTHVGRLKELDKLMRLLSQS